MKQEDKPTTPSLYQNPSGLPIIKRFGAGAFNDTALIIQKVVKKKHTMQAASEHFTITHGLGNVFDLYGIYKIDGEVRMLPDQEFINAIPTIGGVYIKNITKRNVEIYAEFSTAQTLDFTLLFTGIDLNR